MGAPYSACAGMTGRGGTFTVERMPRLGSGKIDDQSVQRLAAAEAQAGSGVVAPMDSRLLGNDG